MLSFGVEVVLSLVEIIVNGFVVDGFLLVLVLCCEADVVVIFVLLDY